MKLLLALFAGLAIFFLSAAVLLSFRKSEAANVKRRVISLSEETSEFRRMRMLEANLKIPFFQRIAVPAQQWVKHALSQITPQSLHEVAARKTNDAGGFYRWGVEGFLAYWMTVGGLIFFIMLFFLCTGAQPLSQRIVIFLFGAAGGFYLPIFLIDLRIAERRRAMIRDLPDLLDLLCVSVQAGLSFDAALSRVVDRMKGPLVEECSRMLQEMRFGMARRQALERLAARCRIQEVSLFIAAVIQADKLGVSLANVLVIQSDNMRESRRQRVKKQAQQAPIKMLFPLGVFLFPAMFIVTLLPALLNLMEGFKGLTP